MQMSFVLLVYQILLQVTNQPPHSSTDSTWHIFWHAGSYKNSKAFFDVIMKTLIILIILVLTAIYIRAGKFQRCSTDTRDTGSIALRLSWSFSNRVYGLCRQSAIVNERSTGSDVGMITTLIFGVITSTQAHHVPLVLLLTSTNIDDVVRHTPLNKAQIQSALAAM